MKTTRSGGISLKRLHGLSLAFVLISLVLFGLAPILIVGRMLLEEAALSGRGSKMKQVGVEPWEFTGQKLLNLAAVSLFGFALPLVFLCFGFVRSSLSRFASFNILIPAYTFVVGGVLVPAELLKLGDPLVLLGVTGMFIGFAVFQWPEFAVSVASRLRDLTFWSRL
ncbi:MAG: hypothetical protein ACK5QT_06645 [Oligoflexia bacterium]